MPLPDGLIPTGTFADINQQPGMQKPPSSSFPEGGSSGLKSLQNAYEPLEWDQFFDS